MSARARAHFDFLSGPCKRGFGFDVTWISLSASELVRGHVHEEKVLRRAPSENEVGWDLRLRKKVKQIRDSDPAHFAPARFFDDHPARGTMENGRWTNVALLAIGLRT